MSFCRITGKSRGLPKPNYFPLLPPISPADAKRFCRITNKSQGLPEHHFIPVLLGARGLRAHCRVTGKSEGQAPHHFPTVDNALKPHDIIPGYKYVFPKFDEDHKLQQRILHLMSTKTLPGEANARYVYAVEERLTGLVLPPGLEAAVRDGEIRDVMLDKDKDTMLVKLHQGPSVAVDITDLIMEEGMVLWDGLGPSQSVLKQWEKEEKEMEVRKKKRQEGLHKRKQIFEDKERAADEEESEMARIKDARKSKVVKVKIRSGPDDANVSVANGPVPLEGHLNDTNHEPVFGHIVQTATAVEFFPGDSILDLPEGKVVPGQLVRNAEGVKFVPGIMADGRFIPGQVVKTNSGEQFVPGQVVDTRNGPKFVPGQVAETISGPKFVPGQTIETEDGPQFVPGQIIETKAGPTFIPGQIIVTDDEPRFVPGRVVETAEGPRFVPGHVVESGNQVTFVPGQVVETSEGLKFVAPDLEHIPEGGHEFSVQAFEVTPEELKLLRPAASCDPATCDIFTVDSKMLRQLSEAGMSVGRQVPTKLPEVDIRPLPVVVEKLKLNGAQALKMSHVMTVLSQVALKVSQRSDLCASEIPLDEDIGDKILCAVQKNKDLGKYLQAIVAASVVAARNNFDEESVLNAVVSALAGALSTEYEDTLTKESILSVINDVVSSQLSGDLDVKERLLADINANMESELKAKLENSLNEESVMKVLNSVLETKLGKENSTSTKATILEAVKSTIEKERCKLLQENVNKENFIAIIGSAMDSGILGKANDLLSKEEVMPHIKEELESWETSAKDSAFSEEVIISLIKSAVEKEVSAKGVTLNNGSLPAIIMAGIKNVLLQKGELALTEEKLLSCLSHVVENELPEEITKTVTKKELLQAVNSAVATEKSRVCQSVLSEKTLLKAAHTALEKAVSAKAEEIPNGGKILEMAFARIKEEASVKSENAEMKKMIQENLEKAIEKKILETSESVLSEEMAIAAVNSALESEFQQKYGMTIAKEKISALIKSTFEKEKALNNSSVIDKETLMAALKETVDGDGLVSNKAVMKAFDAVVEEKRKASYESNLTDQVVLSAIDSAIKAVLCQGKEMKVSEAVLLSSVTTQLNNLKCSGNGNITEGRIIAAVQSVLKEELTAKGEKSSVQELLLESFNSEIENREAKSPRLLSEEEVMATLDSAIAVELSKIQGCPLNKSTLMAKINSAISEKKLKKRESILSEKVLLECMELPISEEVAALGEMASVGETLLTSINAAIQREREAKKNSPLSEDMIVQAVSSAMDSELILNNKISLTKEELVKIVNDTLEVEKLGKPEAIIAEENLIKIVSSAIEKHVSAESEALLILKAFESEIEQERDIARKRPITEKAFIRIIDSALQSELKYHTGTSLDKEKLIRAVSTTIDKEVTKHGDLITEDAILATAYSAIEKEVYERGESVSLKETLLSGIDSVVESRRDTKRLVNEAIILEAINAVADEFMQTTESKAAVLSAVASVMEKAKKDDSLVGKNLLDMVSGVVEDHFRRSSETTLSREAFMTAVSSAIAEEQKAKRGTLMTQEILSKAVSSAVEEQILKNPRLLPMKETLLQAADLAVQNECSSGTEKHLSEKALLSAISSSIEKVLGDLSGATPMEKIVDSMQKYLSENLDVVMVGTVNYMVNNESVMDKLKYAVNNSGNTMQVIEKLSSVLNDNMGEAFQKLSVGDPSLLRSVVGMLNVEKLSTKDEATEALQKAIVGAVRQKSVETLRTLMESSKGASDGNDFKELLLQSVGLARALGMNKVASVLLDVASDSKSHEVLANDETVIDILQRLTIMRQFAETKPELASALTQLISDPELAKRDPCIRELVRHSTALMTVPEEILHSSADIPASLLMSDNSLAMEQFLAKARRPRTLVIVKHGLQAVVPKEASRAVLTGQVPYAVLDERGIKYFEPLHLFSTMKLPYYAAHCFSMYRCPETEYESGSGTPTYQTPRGSFSSAEDYFGRRKSVMANGHRDRHREHGSRFDKYFPVRDIYSVEKDFITDDENSFSLKRGDLVEVINFGSSSEKQATLAHDGEVTSTLDNSAAKHKLSVRPRRKYTDSRQRGVSPFSRETRWLVRTVEGVAQQGWIPSNILKLNSSEEYQLKSDYEFRREGVVKELVETEEEFVRDLQHVVDKYMKPLEKPSVPRIVRDNVDVIFSNFRQIANFHNTVLIEGVKYYSNEPRLLGKTFLRLERDFDKHVAYCRDEAAAQEFLAENQEAKDFFEELSQNIGDDKNLSEHLKLPIQRINDYQLLLKELVKYSSLLEENTKDLEKALELMLAIPHRANDNKFLSNIEGFHGNIHKLGRLIRHDWFTVTYKDSKPKERYLFLFKEHILICKVKRISEDRSVFLLKDIVQLPDVKVISFPDLETFEVHEENSDKYPATICGHKEGVKELWHREISKYAPYVFDVGKNADEDNENSQFYDVKEEFECEQLSSTASIENQAQNESENENNKVVALNNELNIIEDPAKEAKTSDSGTKFVKAEEEELERSKIDAKDIECAAEEGNKMSRRTSTRIAEESYSVSSQREEVYMQSSRNQYSSSSYASATATTSGKSYRSSSIIDTTTNKLAIQGSGKPNFTRTITGLCLEPGETAVFECQLDTEAHVTWLKDNKALEDRLADRVVKSSADDNTHRLELQALIEYDSGIYTALAQNKDGSATCTAQLQVQEISEEEKKRRAEANAPMFTVRLKDTELLRNTNFRFMVKVKGNPNPKVKFLKDGVPVKTDHDRLVLVDEKADIGFYELVISDVQNEDSGTYSCVATNKFGEAHCEGTVTVTDDKKVFEGLEASNLLAPGAKPSFSWLKDGKPFDPEERFKVLLGNEEDSLALVFQHVRPEDAGLYTCVASTTTGRISCSAELSVQGTVSQLAREPEKPRFTTELKENEVNVGGTAMLETKIVGFPKPDVKWFHDGHEIKPSGRFKFLFEDEDTMTLVIKNVTPEDGGTYKVVASNELGEDSTELRLSVKAGPKFKKKMEDVKAMAEETITIAAEVEGTPVPQVKWYKDGTEISASSRTKTENKVEGTYTLVIEKVELSDSGSYSVVASNDVNQCSEFFKMSVVTPPKFVKDLEKSVEVSEGEQIIFKVEVAADPPPQVRWLKDGKEIKADGEKVKITRDGNVYTLEISDAKRDDSAKYTVEVSNDHGTKASDCQARVRCTPLFEESLKNITAKEGDADVEFSVKVNAFPKAKIKWYLGETEITEKRTEYTRKEDGENYKLILKQVTTELKGKYTCKVLNDTGEAECSAHLTVNSKPKFGKTLQPKVQVDEGAELTLQIECSGCPEPEVKWYKDGREIHADAHIKITRDTHRSESYSMTLNLVKGEDAGEYEVQATNIMGTATTKTEVQVTTKNASEENYLDEVEERRKRKQEVEDLTGTTEGEEESHTIFEKTKTTVEFVENEWTGVKIEEIECYRAEENSNAGFPLGLVEEYSESEVKANKLFVNRGVSIVSLSDDERTISRNSMNECDSENEFNDGYNNKDLPSDRDTPVQKDIGSESEGNDEDHLEEAPRKEYTFENRDRPTKCVDIDKGKEGDFTEGVNNLTENKSDSGYPGRSNEDYVDDGGDPEVDKLLKRIKQQRSVLEEILNRESEYQEEEAPEIVSDNLEDRKVTESTSTTYEVKVSGTPKPTVKWFVDGKEMKSSDKVKMYEEGNTFKLELIDLQTSDSGSYSCKVANQLGEKTKGAKLEVSCDVSRKKPNVKTPLLDQKVSKKEEATFKCVLTSESEPEVTWYRNGKKIESDDASVTAKVDVKKADKDVVECTYTLKIPETVQSHAGTYKIKAENKYGFDESSAELTLILKPEIENLKDVTGIPQEEAVFEAKVHFSTDVTWLDKSGKALKTGDRITITEDKGSEVYRLKICDVSKDDAGEYVLVAKNDVGETKQKVRLHVQAEAPTIVKPLEDLRMNDYSDVDFHVRFNGFPKPQVKWFKGGVELTSSERIVIKTLDEGQVSSMLTIKHFNGDDVGEYSVVGSNVAGSAESKCNLKMSQVSPVIGKGFPRSEDVSEGEPLELKCKIDGSPVPSVKWLKNGEPLNADGHVQLLAQPDGTVRLFIENAKPSDSGAYELIAENPNGTATGICAVSVKPKPSKPTIEKGLEHAKGVEGEPLKLTAKVTGFPSPDVKWLKDGHPLRPSQGIAVIDEPDGTVGLAFDNLRPEDAGKYTMKLSNKAGQAEDEAKIEVQPKEKKPIFEAHLLPASTIEGFPAKLQVKAVGHPKPLIKWTHNGIEVVPDGQRIKVVEQPNGMTCLILDKATLDDGGEYAAIACNDKGEVASKADLKVTGRDLPDVPPEKPSFLCPLKDISVNEGKPLCLSATFVGNPLPDALWTKDDIPLKPDDRTLATCDGRKVTLEVHPSACPDSGIYACRLVNPLGEDTCKANATVKKIFEPPVFVKKLSDLQQLPNCDAKLMARVSGMPVPDIEWFFNGEPIKENDKYHMKRDGDVVCLYVRNCAPGDSGRYRCRACNRDGEDFSEANLDVVPEIDKQPRAEAPGFLKKIGDCDVYKGMTAKFTACATGFPEPEFEWYRDSIKLYEGRRVKIDDEGNGLLRLTISNVDIGDVGRYRLRIFNPHGEASCDAELRFESLEPRAKKGMADQYDHYKKIHDTGVPVPLADKPIISRMTDYHLTLSWKPSIPHGPRAPVTYVVEMAEQPDCDWFTVRTGVRSCACEVRNLVPFRDYKFRIRVENKYGISDPSPFAVTYRQRLQPDLPARYLGPGVDFRPESSPYFPKDFDLERPPHDGYKQAPKFLRQEHDTQYGIKNENSNLFWFVYGYPKPVMTYYFNDEPVEMGGRYDCSYTRNGQATLFINKMLERDVGVYEAVAKNEHGEARQRVRMELAEYPRFIQRPEETIILLRDSGRLTARVVGVPYPEIRWYKDWQPLAASSRVSFQQIQPDTVVLLLNDVILKDEGLYSVCARNVAGTVSASVMVHIEENPQEYSYLTYGRGRNVKPRSKPISDLYDLGDELGRGTQGVTYHAVERQTGDNYAAKVMHGRADLKAFMLNELDIMNYLNHRKLIRLHDSYEASDLLILVMELAGGGELLDSLTRQTYITEREIAGYIRQILWGLEYMHTQGIAHLSLTLRDFLISHPGGDDLKICDFGLARKMLFGKPTALYYGMPEYVSPEIVNGDAVGYPADLWALGIITYILLSGYSPFKGLNDRETLTLIKEGKWEFKEEWFVNVSSEARDFITKLLVYEPLKRMDAKTALRHPWLNLIDTSSEEEYKIKTDNLKSYYSSLKEWYKSANCRTWYRRKPLSGAFTHPSKMVYPPGEAYTPEPEIIPKSREPNEPKTWEERIPSREPLDYEIGTFKSESHYQNGPDTYLLQLRDVDLPCRLRHYLKVAANRETGSPLDIVDKHIDWRTPVIRERRRFMDIMDEEIDDERRERINKYGSADVYSIRRLKRELGLRPDGHPEAEAMLEYQREGQLPIFREKPQLLSVVDDQLAELSCFAVGDPKPTVQWFKNDIVISESNRVKMVEDDSGRSYLKFSPALQVDVGIYKVVARNRIGQTTARTRIVVAGVPSSPDSPEATEISDTEILLNWKQPKDDGQSSVLCYSLQYKEAANVEWLNIASNIDHEFWLVKDLKPDTGYVFRLSAKNIIGWSEKGIPSKTIRTKEPGAEKIVISKAMRHVQSHSESGAEITPEEPSEKLNYSIEKKPIEWSADSSLTEKYAFVSEITRGQFSVIAKGMEKSTGRSIVAKVLEVNTETEEAVGREFENFRSLRHERIVTLLAALRPAPNIAVFIMEKLQGADILTYFSCRHEYSEQMVASVITQILDGLQYLHWRGLCHLDIQPDNIVLSKSVRSLQVKLVDFGSAQKVSKLGTIVNVTPTDYSAPEVLNNESAYPQTDIWSVGVLIYVLLSGVSPFKGQDEDETRQNITFVRYRFEYLYKELTQEATRFLMLIFKRTPSKRPTVDECYEHRWLLPTEFMIKKRERAVFLGNRLKEYCDAYHKEKAEKANRTEGLGKAFGDKILARSNSIQEELTTA